jgi:hypothetical protein
MSDIVLADPPQWLQNGAYPARLDRTLIDAVWPTEGPVRGFGVSQRAAGANLSVDVAAGIAVIAGDDQANQGKYLARLTTTTNVPTLGVPTGAGQKRRDLLVVVVRDPDAGGATGNNAVLRWIAGTPTTGTPTTPATPASALALAYIQLADTTTAVTNALITALTGPLVAGGIPVYPDKAALDAGWPNAPDGSQAATLDYGSYPTNGQWMRIGGIWQRVAQVGRTNQTFNASGQSTVTHALGRVPAIVLCTPGAAGNFAMMSDGVLGATTFGLRAYVANTGSPYAGTVAVNWYCA